MQRPVRIGAAAAVLCITAGALAQSTATGSGASGGDAVAGGETRISSYRLDWTVRIEPRAWWVSPSGKIRLPGTDASGNGDQVRVERLNLDTPRFAPYGEVTIRTPTTVGGDGGADDGGGEWRLTFGGGSYSLDRDQTTADSRFQIGSVAVSPGDALHTSFDMTIVEATVGYRFYRYDFRANSVQPAEAFDAALDFFAVGGVRLYDVDVTVQELATTGGTAQSEQVFVEPFAGVRFEMELARNFEADLQVSFGGFADSDKSSLSLDIQIGFAWRPWDQVGVQIGWRQIAYQLSDGQSPGEFEYNGRMAGLFAGVTIRF